MSITVRRANADDAPAVAVLGVEAWGYPADEPPRDPDGAGRTTWLAVDENEHSGDRVVAAVTMREYDSWFWGARVRTAGVASVMVASEYRGRKLLRPLMTRALEHAHGEGAVIATMFPTAPGIYRSLGFEVFTDHVSRLVLPTASLALVRPGEARLRRAERDDLPAVRALYAEWAAAHNGPLARDGVSFGADDDELLAACTGITLAEQDGRMTGYAMWSRTEGYHADGVLQVLDLVTLTDDAARGLLAALGSHATVAPTTVLSTCLPDLSLLPLPARSWRVEQSEGYGLAILDVAGAFAAAQVPPVVETELPFGVAGLPLPDQDGNYRMRATDGRVEITEEPGRAVDATERVLFTARGLALRFTGTASNTALRRAGLLTGPSSDDPTWDALFSGRCAQVRDYF